MKTVIATTNSGKYREIKDLLKPLGWKTLKLDKGYKQIPENANSFVANCLLKARAAARHCNAPAISDDSGTLEIFDRDGTTRLEVVDENGLGEGEIYLFMPESDGMYHLKVTDVVPQPFRLNTEYELAVFYETGELNGFPQGFVIDDSTNEPLPEFRIKIFNDNATFWDFAYGCLGVTIACDEEDEKCGKYDTPGLEKGDYQMEVSSAGYEPEIVPLTLEANQVACHIFNLKPENSPPNTIFTITVNDFYQLKFGQIPSASNDFDTVYDEIYTLNNDGNANVYLLNKKILDPTQQALMSDFRPVEETTRWRLMVDRGGSVSKVVNLTWEMPDLGNDYRVYLQELDNERPIGAPIDMTESELLSIFSDSSFEIGYSQTITEQLNLNPGWNLCSIPVMTLITNEHLSSQIDDADVYWKRIWHWDTDQYKVVPEGHSLNPERGYWVMNPGVDTSTFNFNGILADGLMTLRKGWNLVAPVVECPKPQKSEIIGHTWWWDSELQRYKVVRENEILNIGHGYWIYANKACEVTLNTLGHENSQN